MSEIEKVMEAVAKLTDLAELVKEIERDNGRSGSIFDSNLFSTPKAPRQDGISKKTIEELTPTVKSFLEAATKAIEIESGRAAAKTKEGDNKIHQDALTAAGYIAAEISTLTNGINALVKDGKVDRMLKDRYGKDEENLTPEEKEYKRLVTMLESRKEEFKIQYAIAYNRSYY